MNRFNIISLFAAIAGVYLMLHSCSTSSQLALSWNAPGLKLKQYKKILIIGLMGDKDDPLRQDVELDMASALEMHGIKVYSSYEKFGSETSRFNGDSTAIQAFHAIIDSTYDAVICVVLLDKSKQTRPATGIISPALGYYYPPYSSGSYFNNYNGFGNYFYQSYNTVYQPNYYITTTQYTVETNIFDSSNDSLVYYSETKIKNPSHLEDLSKMITKSVINDMTRKKIIIPLQEK